MNTNCEECSEEVDDSEVGHCQECGADGLCPKCVEEHAMGNHSEDDWAEKEGGD